MNVPHIIMNKIIRVLRQLRGAKSLANIPIRNIALTGTPAANSSIVFDDGQMKRGTVASMADAVRPVASQAEAEAGLIMLRP